MPELPEVELYRRQFEEVALDQVIKAVETENEGRMVPSGLENLRKTTVGKAMVETERIGKYLFVRLSDGGPWLMWHFGLTGSFTYYQDEEMQHRFARIFFHFENGWILSFNSMRKFSRLEITDSLEAYQKKKKLGQDAGRISLEDFTQALQSKTMQIKPALLEQKKFAGVGNWMADEMLLWTRLHPETRCNEIDTEAYHHLHAALQEIIQTAIDYGAYYESFPEKYLVRVREDGGHCPRCDRELTRLVVGGRGTYICENCQGSSPEG